MRVRVLTTNGKRRTESVRDKPSLCTLVGKKAVQISIEICAVGTNFETVYISIQFATVLSTYSFIQQEDVGLILLL